MSPAELLARIRDGVQVPGPSELGAVVGLTGAPAQGWAPPEQPDLCQALRRAGVPLWPGASKTGPWLSVNETHTGHPTFDGATLRLPPPASWAKANAVQLMPIRQWLRVHVSIRMECAPGIFMVPFPDRTLFLNSQATTLGGFIYGPEHGQRAAISLTSHEHQLIRWTLRS